MSCFNRFSYKCINTVIWWLVHWQLLLSVFSFFYSSRTLYMIVGGWTFDTHLYRQLFSLQHCILCLYLLSYMYFSTLCVDGIWLFWWRQGQITGRPVDCSRWCVRKQFKKFLVQAKIILVAFRSLNVLI